MIPWCQNGKETTTTFLFLTTWTYLLYLRCVKRAKVSSVWPFVCLYLFSSVKSYSLYIYILGKESRQYIYVSNHPNNTRQVEKICDILKKEHGLECLRSNYQDISSGIGNDVVLRLTEDFRKASHYLVYLSWDYMSDAFCQFGEPLRNDNISLLNFLWTFCSNYLMKLWPLVNLIYYVINCNVQFKSHFNEILYYNLYKTWWNNVIIMYFAY